MKYHKRFLVSYKVLFALLGLTAIITEIVVINDRGTFSAGNFFSYFTIESNLFAAIILGISALLILRGTDSKRFTNIRGAATLYMVTTGIVFSTLLSNLDPSILTAVPWDNAVLHYIMPIALLIDWIIDPPKKRIIFMKTLPWLLFPLVYLAYSLIRGAMVGWYPYPFLNPSDGGYAKIAIVSAGISVVVLFIGWLLTWCYARKK